MNDQVFPRSVLIAWAAAAVAIFAVTLYLMGGGELTGPTSVGPSTYSRSTIGHAGFADMLQRLNIPVVKSRYNSADRAGGGSVTVLAEPQVVRQIDDETRTLLGANTLLLVLPKW